MVVFHPEFDVLYITLKYILTFLVLVLFLFKVVIPFVVYVALGDVGSKIYDFSSSLRSNLFSKNIEYLLSANFIYTPLVKDGIALFLYDFDLRTIVSYLPSEKKCFVFTEDGSVNLCKNHPLACVGKTCLCYFLLDNVDFLFSTEGVFLETGFSLNIGSHSASIEIRYYPPETPLFLYSYIKYLSIPGTSCGLSTGFVGIPAPISSREFESLDSSVVDKNNLLNDMRCIDCFIKPSCNSPLPFDKSSLDLIESCSNYTVEYLETFFKKFTEIFLQAIYPKISSKINDHVFCIVLSRVDKEVKVFPVFGGYLYHTMVFPSNFYLCPILIGFFGKRELFDVGIESFGFLRTGGWAPASRITLIPMDFIFKPVDKSKTKGCLYITLS